MRTDWPAIVKRLRKKYGLSQAEMAEKLRVHVMTVSRWERGITWPRYPHDTPDEMERRLA